MLLEGEIAVPGLVPERRQVLAQVQSGMVLFATYVFLFLGNRIIKRNTPENIRGFVHVAGSPAAPKKLQFRSSNFFY